MSRSALSTVSQASPLEKRREAAHKMDIYEYKQYSSPNRISDPSTIQRANASPPLKLMNRFKKKENRGSTVQKAVVNSENVEDSKSPIVEKNDRTRAQGRANESKDYASLLEELQSVKSERDELLMEKSFWLSKFQSDNAGLLKVLNHAKEVKVKVLQEIDSLEKEKDRLRSIQLDGVESSVLERVLDNSPLAETNRTTLPAHLRGKADELHKTLVTLATKCRSNQLQIFEKIVSLVEESENHFLDRNESAVENAISELKNIASSSPGNVMAAVNVSKKYPEVMLAALIEKRDDVIRDATLRGARGGSAVDGVQDKDIKAADDVTKTLMAQNNTLRASVAQLRKKNAELKARVGSLEATAEDSRGPRAKPSRAVKRGSLAVPPGAERAYFLEEKEQDEDAANEEEERRRAEDREETLHKEEEAASARRDNRRKDGLPRSVRNDSDKQDSLAADRKSVLSISREDNSFDALPDFVRELAWGSILSAVQRVTAENPLSADIGQEALQRVQREVALEMRESAAPALWVLGGRERWGQASTAGRHLEHSEDISRAVQQCFQTPQVHTELASVAMLALTYIHSRFANTGRLESSSSQSPRQGDGSPDKLGDEDEADDEQRGRQYSSSDSHMFGDSSVLFQSPSHFTGGSVQQVEQFTLNPKGNPNKNPRYIAANSKGFQ